MKLNEIMKKTSDEVTVGESLKLSAVVMAGAIGAYVLGYGIILGIGYLKDKKEEKTEQNSVNEVTEEESGLE